MKKSKTTLSQKLFGYYFSLSIITIIILSVYSYHNSKSAIVSRTYDQLNSVKFEKERNLENFFQERLYEVNNLRQFEYWNSIINQLNLLSASKNNEEQIKSKIALEIKNSILRSLRDNKNFRNLFILDGDNECRINLTGSLSGTEISFDKSSFRRPDLRKSIESKSLTIVEDLLMKKIYVSAHVHLPDEPLKKQVYILLEIDMLPIDAIMYNTNILNGLGMTGEAYIVDCNKILRTSSRFKTSAVNQNIVNTEGVVSALKNSNGNGVYNDYRNVRVLGSFNKVNISGLNWVILVEIDYKEAMIPIYNLRNSIIILSLIISILIFGIVIIISAMISRPVIKLRQAAESIAQGTFEVVPEVKTSDEIGDLTRAFNVMVNKIKMQNDEIQLERAKRITSVLDGQEQERQRLSRELHDGLGQHILAIKMKLERAENAVGDNKQQIIAEAKNLLVDASREIISMSENLMPPVLTQFGLISAIDNLCKDVGAANKMNVNFNFNDIPENCDNQTKIYLYRILQEALNNVIKHAQATEVLINIDYQKNRFELRIADNGKGFNPNEQKRAGNGIYNMRERVEILGGQFDIESVTGNGTIITILIENIF
jgi:signal transduction histidine kinase